MHVFKFSPRIGTKAADFPNQIDGTKKDSRSEKLIELSENNEREFANKYIGKEIEVLFENGHDGHTTNYIEVYSENEHLRSIIAYGMECLTDVEKTIIKMSFGIENDREYDNNEIGEVVNYTAERVRQLKNKALEKMQSYLKHSRKMAM
jgi:tRNA A37 methylthiotransferase MiaB